MTDQIKNSTTDYVTIVGESFDDVWSEYRTRRLSEHEYTIVSPVVRHRFMIAGASAAAAINDQSLIVATFARRT
jgi:hypothetical protein